MQSKLASQATFQSLRGLYFGFRRKFATDDLLKAAAERLRGCMRDNDTVARGPQVTLRRGSEYL